MNSDAQTHDVKSDYKSIIDALPYASILIGYDSVSYTILQVNQEFKHTFLYKEERFTDKNFFDLFIDYKGLMSKSFKKVISSGKQSTVEVSNYGLKRDDSNLKRVNIINSMFRGDDETTYILHTVNLLPTTVSDENNRLQSRLEQAEEMAAFGTWELDLNSNDIYWSDGIFKICGYTRDEYKVTFDSAIEVIHPEDRARTIHEMQRVMKEGGYFSIRMRLIAKGKRVRQVLSKGKLVKNSKGEPEKLIGVFIDITERLLYEEVELKLTENSKKFQELFQEAQQVAEIGTWEIDLIRDTLYWSDMTKQIHEVEDDYFPNLDEAIEFYLEGEDRAKIQLAVGATMKSGEAYDLELQIITAKGNHKWVRTTGRADFFNNKVVRIYGALQDITVQKELEKTLRNSTVKYQSLVESVNGILWEAEADTFKFNYISDKCREILGFEPKEWFSDPLFWSRNMHPDDRNDAVSYCKKMTKKGLDHNFEYRMVSKSGEEVWIRDYVTVVSEDGKPNILRGIMLDITELKVAENMVSEALYELKTRNDFIETALENLPIGFAVNKIDSGEAVLMNKKFTEVYGWSEADMKDRSTFFECIYPDPDYREEMTTRILDDLESHDASRMQWNGIKIFTKDGEIKFVDAKNIPLYEQNLMISTVIDVTDQLEKKNKLEQLSLVASKTSEIVLILNANGRIEWVNETFVKITEYSLGEVKDKIPGQILTGPETDSIIEKRILHAVGDCKPIQTEIINYSKSGKKYWVEISVDPVIDNQGRCTAFVVLGNDITKRKKKDLQILNSLREKEVLLAEIHHRVKNNLAVVSSMMQLQAFRESDDKVVSKLLDSTFRIRTMATIHELLYQSGSFSELKFSDIIDELIQNIEKVLNNGKEIQFKVDHDDLELNINQAIPCSLIINEVITNIFKHAFPNQMSGIVDISLKTDGDMVHIKIEDNGKGLPANFDFESTKSLGTNIINILSKQIEGECSYSNGKKGAIFELSFKKSDLPGAGSANLK